MSPKPQPQAEPRPEPPPPSPDEFYVYTVVEGDTLTSIAKRYNVTVRQLVEANKIQEPHLIRVGQRLLIPGVLEPPAVRPETSPQPPPPQPRPSPEFKPQPTGQIDPIFHLSVPPTRFGRCMSAILPSAIPKRASAFLNCSKRPSLMPW